MKRIGSVAIVIGLACVGGACKKKAAEGDGSGSGSAAMTGSDVGSGSGSAMAGSGSAMAAGSGSGSGSGSAMAAGSDTGSGSGSGTTEPFATMLSDETNGNREADLKAATDKAVAQLPADAKTGQFGAHVILKKLEAGAKYTCTIEVDVMTMPDRAVFAPLVHSGEVTPEKGKEKEAEGDCIEAVLEHAIVQEVTKAIADKKAGKPFDDGAAGSGSGSGSAAAGSAAAGSGGAGSATPAKK